MKRHLALLPILILGFFLATQAHATEPVPIQCLVQSAVTSADQVTFEVGPEDCNVPVVGDVTFSAYDLAANDGSVLPYNGQVAVDHVTGAGVGAGTYTWNTDSEGSCGGQWDFYNSPPQPSAPHTTWFPGIYGPGISWFVIEVDDCDEPEVTPTPTPTPTVTPTPTPVVECCDDEPQPTPTPGAPSPEVTPEPTPTVVLIPPAPVVTPVATPTATPQPVPSVPVAPQPADTGSGGLPDHTVPIGLIYVLGILTVALVAVGHSATRR